MRKLSIAKVLSKEHSPGFFVVPDDFSGFFRAIIHRNTSMSRILGVFGPDRNFNISSPCSHRKCIQCPRFSPYTKLKSHIRAAIPCVVRFPETQIKISSLPESSPSSSHSPPSLPIEPLTYPSLKLEPIPASEYYRVTKGSRSVILSIRGAGNVTMGNANCRNVACCPTHLNLICHSWKLYRLKR